jgi:hypothetical protein
MYRVIGVGFYEIMDDEGRVYFTDTSERLVKRVCDLMNLAHKDALRLAARMIRESPETTSRRPGDMASAIERVGG